MLQLLIVLRKDVADRAEAVVLVDAVKAKLAGRPDIIVTSETHESLPDDNPV